MVMDACGRQTFTRGERLVARGGASNVSPSKSADASRLTVEGDVADGAQTYHASAQIDLARNEIVSHTCTCGGATDELCKHGVAGFMSW